MNIAETPDPVKLSVNVKLPDLHHFLWLAIYDERIYVSCIFVILV